MRYLIKHDLEIPERLKIVVLKLCPEIMDITPVGYTEHMSYCSDTYTPITLFQVDVDISFNECELPLKNKEEYGSLITDYLRMTYTNTSFISIVVRSFILPKNKTNEEKFLDLFGKKLR